VLKILFLSVCYTVAFYTSTILANYCSPLLLIGLRGLISGILLLVIRYSYEGRIRTNLRKYKHQYFHAIVFGFIIPFALTALVLNHLPIVDSTIIATTEPILTYILAAYFFKESLNKKQIVYLFLGTAFAFTAIIIEAQLERVSLISWKEPAVLMLALILAIGWLAIGNLVKLKEPEDAIVGIGLITTGLVASVMSFHFEDMSYTADFIPITLFILMILFGDLIVTRMRVKLSKEYSTTLLSLICIFVPFITALHQEIFNHKHYSYKFFLIIIPSLICFMAFYYEETKHQSKKIKS
jgi:drug/metabolite transporter (DMT)-like permease